MGKYDILSGKTINTTTPYGLLMRLIIENTSVIYLDVIDKNTIDCSLDNVLWFTLNKKLGEILLAMSKFCDNIKVKGGQ